MIIEKGTHEDFKHCALEVLCTGDYGDGQAPLWLIARMSALNRPPSTLEAVKAQWKASCDFSSVLTAKTYAKFSGTLR